MSKINDAIAKMTEECNKHEDLIPIEEYFTGICTTDEIAEKILDPKKSLMGAIRAMGEIARKSRRTNIPDAEGYEIMRNYFGIELKEDQFKNIAQVIQNASDSEELKKLRADAKAKAWEHQGNAGEEVYNFMIKKDKELEEKI